MGNKFCSCFKPKVNVESTDRRPGLFKNVKVRIFGGKKDATVSIETSAATQEETAYKQEEVLGKIERASLFCVTPNRQAVSRALPIEQNTSSDRKTTASVLPDEKLAPESKEKCETAGFTSSSSKEAAAFSEHTEEHATSDNKQTATSCQVEPAKPLLADSVPDADIPDEKEALMATACKSTTDDNIATQEPGKDKKDNENILIKIPELAASASASIEDFKLKTVIPECKCTLTITADRTLTDSEYYGVLDHGNDLTENDNELNTTNDKTVPEPAEDLKSQTGIPNRESAPTLTDNETTFYSDCNTAFGHRKDQTDRDEGLPTCSYKTAPNTEDIGLQTGILDRKRAPDLTADDVNDVDDNTTDKDCNTTVDHGKDLTDNNVGLNSTTTQPARVKVSMEAFELQTIFADRKSSSELTAIETTTQNDKSINLYHGKYLREKNEENTPTAEKSVLTQALEKDTQPNTGRDIPDRKTEPNTSDISTFKNKDVVASAIREELKGTDPRQKMTFARVESTHVNNTNVFPSHSCLTTSTTFTTGKMTSTIAPEGTTNNLCKDGAYAIPKNVLSVQRDQENKTENVINGKITMHAATTTICESNLATRTSTSYKCMTDAIISKEYNEVNSDQRKIPESTSASASTSVNIQPLSMLKGNMVDTTLKGIAQDIKKTIEKDPSKAISTNSFISSVEKNKISKALSEIPTFNAGNSGTRNVLQTSTVLDQSKSDSIAKVTISCKQKTENHMRKVTSSHTPSVSSTEALETLRKLAKMLAAAKSSAGLVSQSELTDDKSSTQLVKQYERPASSVSHTTATSFTAASTKSSIEATDQLPLLPCSNDPPRINITKCQSLPAILESRERKKVSDFIVPKTEKASRMKPLKIKPQPKHLYAVPAIAKADIENEANKNWTQHDSSSVKAQMPWMSRRPQFDVTFPKPGKTLLQSLGSVDKILAHRVVPLPKRIERLKVDFGRFPGLRIKPNDVRRYPSIFNLTPSQTRLHEEADEGEDGR